MRDFGLKAVAIVSVICVVIAITLDLGLWPHQIVVRASQHEQRIEVLEKRIEGIAETESRIESKLDALSDKVERILHGKGPEQLYLGKQPERKK